MMKPTLHEAQRQLQRAGRRLQRSSSPTLARVLALATRRIGLRRRPAARRVAHAIIEWTPRRVPEVPTRANGIRYVVDLRDNLQRTLFYLGEYEGELQDLLVEDLREGDVLVDVGANIGIHALPAARRLAPLHGRAIAFEPAGDTADRLERLARMNGLALEVERVALGAETTTGTLRQSPNWDPNDLGVRSLYNEGDAVAEIQVRTFDDWAEERGLDRLDIVKIDVEGAEYDVIAGMRRSITRLRPRLVVVEVIEYFLQRAGSSSAALDELMVELGYRIQGATVAEIVTGPTGPLWPMAVYRPA
jgi:FkbM family methyltransferase